MEKREEVRITPAVHKFMSVFLVLFFFFFKYVLKILNCCTRVAGV